MGYISIINKWNLEENKWLTPLTIKEKGRSASLANYKSNFKNLEVGYDYVILAYGTRLEDHSKNLKDIKNSICGIDKIINYFENKNKNVIAQLYMMDADAPIVEDAKLLAEYIDKLSNQVTVNSINFIGLSKGAAMAFHIPKYFKNRNSYSKSNIYTVATPFSGTLLASPKIFYPEVKKLLNAKLGDNILSKNVYKALISFYEKISSNSHMDYDISMLGGIPEEKQHLYDETLIKDMFSKQNINAITKVANYKNIVTGIDELTLKESLKTMNFIGIGLCILNDWFFDKESDGMVRTSSQRLVETHINTLKSDVLKSSHHDIASNDRVFKDMLYIVNSTIDEENEKIKYRIKTKRY